MTDIARYRWIADHVLPCEREVRRWLRRKVQGALSSADVDDLVQAGYARLMQANLPVVRDGCSFFRRTIYNLWLDQRRQARVVPIDPLERVDPLYIDGAPGPEQRASARQQFERLVQAVERLSPKQRTAFELKHFVGLSIQKIAERMTVTERTVETHLRLARVQVTRSILDEERIGHQESEVGEVDHEAAGKRD